MEEWKDIEGYEGLYQVSNEGRVKNNKGYILTGSNNNKTKYIHVTLFKNKTKNTQNIHILVAKAFIPNPENKPCVDHINGCRTDNRVENLRWLTYKENNSTELAKKRQRESKLGEKNPMYGKKPWNYGVKMSDDLIEKNRISHTGLVYPTKRKVVIQIKKDGCIKKWATTREAEVEGYSQGRISIACNGNHKYKGCYWYFENDYNNIIKADEVLFN